MALLHGQFFALDASSVFSNVTSLTDRRKYRVLANRDENEDERILRGIVSLFLSLGCVLHAPGKGHDYINQLG